MKNKILREKFKQIFYGHFHFPITYEMEHALDNMEKAFADERTKLLALFESWLVDEDIHTYSDGKVSPMGFRSQGSNAMCSRLRAKVQEMKGKTV